MPTNDFKPFATAGGANVSTQAEYLALAALSTGWQSGKASSKEINKAVRQATFIASALAQFVSDKGAVDVLDDGNLAGFGTNLIAAMNKTSQPLDATLTALAALVGAANKLPYFNGADTAALTDLTQVGRDIIGKNAIADVLQYLGLDRIDQDSTETRIWSPDKKFYILIQNGVWGAYSTSAPAGGVALGLGFGGTGAKDAAGARDNFGLGSSATRDVGATVNTVAAGDDSRITGAMQKSQNGGDIPDASAFRGHLGLDSAATRAVGTGANQIPDMNAFTASLSGAGWAKLPNGLIMQWGGSAPATPSQPDVLVTFPIPFPSGVLVLNEHDRDGNLALTLWQLNNVTRTAFYAGAIGGIKRGNIEVQPVSASAGCQWFAIGY